jgi:hypothetical protein
MTRRKGFAPVAQSSDQDSADSRLSAGERDISPEAESERSFHGERYILPACEERSYSSSAGTRTGSDQRSGTSASHSAYACARSRSAAHQDPIALSMASADPGVSSGGYAVNRTVQVKRIQLHAEFSATLESS